MKSHRIDFSTIEWEPPIPGVRHKVTQDGTRKLRLVEYSSHMKPHWCEKGHYGYLLEGRLELEFEDGKEVVEAGDGLFIPDGPQHRHKATVLSGKVRAIFVEDV